MRLILLFVCLFSLVLPRGAAIYAASQHISYPVQSKATGKTLNTSRTVATFYVRTEATDAIDLEVLPAEDTDDDDSDGLFKARCKVLAAYVPAHSHPSYRKLLKLHSNSFWTYTPVLRQQADLYLLQGVLRI